MSHNVPSTVKFQLWHISSCKYGYMCVHACVYASQMFCFTVKRSYGGWKKMNILRSNKLNYLGYWTLGGTFLVLLLSSSSIYFVLFFCDHVVVDAPGGARRPQDKSFESAVRFDVFAWSTSKNKSIHSVISRRSRAKGWHNGRDCCT